MTGWPRTGSVLALLFVLPAVAAQARSADWWEAETPNFVVLSNASEKRAKKLARDFEQIRAVFARAIPGLPPRPGAHLEIFAAKDVTTLAALLPHYIETGNDGIERLPEGIFQRTPDRSFVVLLHDASDSESLRLIYHEYFHYLMTSAMPWAPLWLHEGLAGLWENTVVKGKRVEMARPSERYLSLLRKEQLIPIEELLEADRSAAQFRDVDHSTLFYAQSWALAHYLILGSDRDQTRPRLDAFMRLLRDGVAHREAFHRSIGDPKDLEQQLRSHVQRFSFGALRIETPPGMSDESVTTRKLDAAESLARRGSFFVQGRHAEDARRLLEGALELDPRQPLALEGLGILMAFERRDQEALEFLDAAIAAGANDGLAHYYRAVVMGRSRGSPAGEDRLLEMQRGLEEAVELDPYHASALANLASVYALRDVSIDRALDLGRRAVALSPDDAMVHAAFGMALKRDGQLDGAIIFLERAVRLSDGMKLAISQLEEANRAKDERLRFTGTWRSEPSWLKIEANGLVLWCRLEESGMERAWGRLVENRLRWEDEGRPKQTLEREGESLRMASATVRLDFERSAALPARCLSRR